MADTQGPGTAVQLPRFWAAFEDALGIGMSGRAGDVLLRRGRTRVEGSGGGDGGSSSAWQGSGSGGAVAGSGGSPSQGNELRSPACLEQSTGGAAGAGGEAAAQLGQVIRDGVEGWCGRKGSKQQQSAAMARVRVRSRFRPGRGAAVEDVYA